MLHTHTHTHTTQHNTHTTHTTQSEKARHVLVETNKVNQGTDEYNLRMSRKLKCTPFGEERISSYINFTQYYIDIIIRLYTEASTHCQLSVSVLGLLRASIKPPHHDSLPTPLSLSDRQTGRCADCKRANRSHWPDGGWPTAGVQAVWRHQ